MWSDNVHKYRGIMKIYFFFLKGLVCGNVAKILPQVVHYEGFRESTAGIHEEGRAGEQDTMTMMK